jgi:hypothetical protein
MDEKYIYQVVVTRNGKYRSRWGTKRMVIDILRTNRTFDRSSRSYDIRHKFADIKVMRVPLSAFEDVTHEFTGDDEE